MTVRGGDLGRIARILHGGPELPFVLALDPTMHAWARRVAKEAPPHVLFPVIGQAAVPSQAMFVELPVAEGGTGIFAEQDAEGRILVSRVDCDAEEVWIRSMVAVLSPPEVRPEVDWRLADAPSWPVDQAADDLWSAWASRHLSFAMRTGEPVPTPEERHRIVWGVLIPDLVTVAACFSRLGQHVGFVSRSGGPLSPLGSGGRA